MQSFTLLDRRLGIHNKKQILIHVDRHECTYLGFRNYLQDIFGVPMKSLVTYIDDDGDEFTLTCSDDFDEALEVLRTTCQRWGVPLIVNRILYNKQITSVYSYWKTRDLVAILSNSSVPTNTMTKIKDATASIEHLIPEEWKEDVKEHNMNSLRLEQVKKDKQCIECIEQNKVQYSNSTPKINDCIETQKAVEKIIAEMRETLEKFRNIHVSMKQCSDTLPSSPPSWFTHYMESMKKDMISTITNKVTENLTKPLNQRLDIFEPMILNEVDQLRSIRSQFYFPKQYPRCPNLHFSENNQKRKKTQDEKQFNVALTKCLKDLKTNITKDNSKRKLRETLPYDLEQHNEDILCFDDKMFDCFPKVINHFDKDTNKEEEQSVQTNMSEECTSQRTLPSQIEKNTEEAFQSQKIFDGDLRMNCSIIGHQMLDKDRCKDRRYCSISDIDNISCCSNNSNMINDQEEASFEVIQIPNMTNIEHLEKPAENEKENDSNRDSPSFELLSETPSSPFSMCEDHFSINEGDLQPLEKTELSKNIHYVVNIDNKIYNKHSSIDPDKHININMEKHMESVETNVPNKNATVSFSSNFINGLEISPNYPLHVKEQSKEQENTHVSYPDMCNLNKQNDSKGTQYPEEPSPYPKTHCQCSYQSQTDSVDSALSFHSHTTSVTDDPYADAYSSIQFSRDCGKEYKETKIITPDNSKKEMKVDEERHQDRPKYQFASIPSDRFIY